MERTTNRFASGTVQPVNDVMGVEKMCVVDDNGGNAYVLPPDYLDSLPGRSVVVLLSFHSNIIREVFHRDELPMHNGHLSYRIGAHGRVVTERV